jgi:hypothetical protein
MRAGHTRAGLPSRRMSGTVKRTWNVPRELSEALEREAARQRSTVTAVLHGILGRALAQRDPLEETRAIEARVAATLERQGRDIERLQRSQQVTLALLDGLTKALLLRLEDPPAERLRERRAQAQLTYERLVRHVGRELRLEGGLAAGLREELPPMTDAPAGEGEAAEARA